MSNPNSGIYLITNEVTRDRYIGQSSNLSRRKAHHLWDLRKGTHRNVHLQRAWDKHGEESFRFSIVERCPTEMLNEREQWYLDHWKPEYNMARCAEAPMRGYCWRPETNEKRAMANRGQVRSEESRERMRQAKLGKKQSPEMVEKRASALRGRKKAPMPQEIRDKISATKTGKSRGPHSEETRRKIGEANRGRVRSEESRREQSERMTGTVMPEETRAKISRSTRGVPKHHGVS